MTARMMLAGVRDRIDVAERHKFTTMGITVVESRALVALAEEALKMTVALAYLAAFPGFAIHDETKDGRAEFWLVVDDGTEVRSASLPDALFRLAGALGWDGT